VAELCFPQHALCNRSKLVPSPIAAAKIARRELVKNTCAKLGSASALVSAGRGEAEFAEEDRGSAHAALGRCKSKKSKEGYSVRKSRGH